MEKWIMGGAGILLSIAGIIFVIFKERVARWNRRNIESRFGDNDLGAARHSTPAMMLLLGILFILGGISLVVRSTLS